MAATSNFARLPSAVVRASKLLQPLKAPSCSISVRICAQGVFSNSQCARRDLAAAAAARTRRAISGEVKTAETCGAASAEARGARAAAGGAGQRIGGGASRGAAREAQVRERNKNFAMWMLAIAIGTAGMSYASVPLYRMFCQVTGFGGTVRRVDGDGDDFETDLDEVEIVQGRPIVVRFNADVSARVPWRFTPSQPEVTILPGETALAFYVAENRSSEAITGIATYNVTPSKAVFFR
jgi:cytochrome c oxidase assembly protein subunit 11